jgi:hypothetical protein
MYGLGLGLRLGLGLGLGIVIILPYIFTLRFAGQFRRLMCDLLFFFSFVSSLSSDAVMIHFERLSSYSEKLNCFI